MVKTGARIFRVWRRQADVARSEIAFGFSMRGSASGRSRYRYKSLLVCILAIHTQDNRNSSLMQAVVPSLAGIIKRGGGLVGSSGGRRFVVSRRHLFVAIVVAAPSARYRVPPWMAMAGRANYVAIMRHANYAMLGYRRRFRAPSEVCVSTVACSRAAEIILFRYALHL